MLSDDWTIPDFYPLDWLPKGVRPTAYSGDASDLPTEMLQAYLDAVSTGTAQVPLGRTYPLAEIVQAHHDLEGLFGSTRRTRPRSGPTSGGDRRVVQRLGRLAVVERAQSFTERRPPAKPYARKRPRLRSIYDSEVSRVLGTTRALGTAPAELLEANPALHTRLGRLRDQTRAAGEVIGPTHLRRLGLDARDIRGKMPPRSATTVAVNR